ncbi:hypothetical protein STEG23_025071 [Scotinomys teguina]
MTAMVIIEEKGLVLDIRNEQSVLVTVLNSFSYPLSTEQRTVEHQNMRHKDCEALYEPYFMAKKIEAHGHSAIHILM